MTLLPLSACGGGGTAGGGGGGTPTPPAPAEPAEFIESPTDTWIARDNRNTTLDQADATTDLTVTGKSGNDTIHTGSGADNIMGAAGNDIIRAGEGADTVDAGNGNDAIVLIGTTTAGQYDQADINNAGNGYNLSNIITLADLNGRTVSEVVAGESINGGAGTNTLFIYGNVDLTGVTVSNVTVLEIHSTVTITPDQLAMFTTVNGDGTSVINIDVPSGDTYVLDLTGMSVDEIAEINVTGNLTFRISDTSQLDGITDVNSTSGTITLDVVDAGSDTVVDLGEIADTFNVIDEITLDDQVTLDILDGTDITGLGLTDIGGSGEVNTNGNSTTQNTLDTNVTLGGTVSIALPELSINDPSEDEVEATEPFTVTLSFASSATVTVDYNLSNGQNGTLTFNPGETVQTITANWTDDSTDENNETITATLSNPSNADIADATGVLTILDDDNPPSLSINNIAVDEVDETGTFTVTLSQASGKTVTVDYTAPDGSTGTLTFNPGDTQKTFSTAWTDDTTDENDEIVNATLSNPTNATIADGTGQLNIQDDDNPPTISINNTSADEADEIATFTVTLSEASGKTVTVDYTAPDGGTGTLTFNAGETQKTFTTTWSDDSTDEDNETANATLSNPSNASIADGSGQLTILDDDPSPTISINDISADEIDETATFTVTLSNSSIRTITVDYTAPDGSTGTLTFNPGDTQKTFTTAWSDDFNREDDEVVNATLSNPTNATIADGSGQLTIQDDDHTVAFSDGTRLMDLSLSSNSVTRGEDGIELTFDLNGNAATIHVEVTDQFGNTDLYSFTGTSGTMALEMDGRENQTSAHGMTNVSSYQVSSVYFEDSNGNISYLDNQNFTDYSFNKTVSVSSGTVSSPTVSMSLSSFSLGSSAITLGDGETPQIITFDTTINSGLVDGVMVKFEDANGVLHSTFFSGSSGETALMFDEQIAESGTYTLYSVEVFDHSGNSVVYNKSQIDTLFGASESTFTLTNTESIDFTVPTSTKDSFLPWDLYNPSGIDYVDGVLSGYGYQTNADGSPLIITYSFGHPDNSEFRSNYSDNNYEAASKIDQFTGEQQAIVREMLSQISEDVNIIFVEVPDDGNEAGNMRFTWTENGFETPNNAFAWAYYPFSHATAGDVWFSEETILPEMNLDVTNTLFKNTIIHEIGHALGLKHTFEEDGLFNEMPNQFDGKDYTMMAYDIVATNAAGFTENSAPTDLMWIDILALQYVYGANYTFSAGDDVYHIMPEQWNYHTLWDYSGVDTLDASNFTAGVNINLDPGSWSNVGIVIDVTTNSGDAFNQTLHIAPDTFIENVVGGSGNDILSGNIKDNVITGGAGNDTMVGDDGDDTFIIDGNSNFSSDSINGGNDRDTVQVSGVTNFDANNLTILNVEMFNIAVGNHAQTFTIDASDVVAKTSGANTLFIKGDATDTINTASTWLTNGTVTNVHAKTDGTFYVTYTSGSATIYMDVEIGTLSNFPAFSFETFNEITSTSYAGGDGTITGTATLAMRSSSEDLTVTSIGFNNIMTGSGDDTVTSTNGGDFYIDGGGADALTNISTISYANSDAGVNVDLANGTATGGYAEGDTFDNSGITDVTVYGSSKDDTLKAGTDNASLHGLKGDDTLIGGTGTDTLDGGEGNDMIHYGAGDTIRGGDGYDYLILQDDLDLSTETLLTLEEVDVSGGGNQTVTLAVQDVLDLTDADNKLIISGDSGDAVTSTGEGWVQGADTYIENEVYNVYTSGGATLLIDEDISQTIT
nr:Calx-beta domain-containing protein [Pseudemcibacter aquimaris]